MLLGGGSRLYSSEFHWVLFNLCTVDSPIVQAEVSKLQDALDAAEFQLKSAVRGASEDQVCVLQYCFSCGSSE